jgi:hydrogenase/urease accessory protein HupE
LENFMKLLTQNTARGLGLTALGLFAGLAEAHTGHGTSGISEGLAHPFGADHLLAMVAVGIWSFSAYAAGFLATTIVLHFGGVAIGLGIRKALAEKATWVVTGLGTLCSGAGLYLFSQL